MSNDYSDHFGLDSRMVIGAADEYERQIGDWPRPKRRNPRLAFDISRGKPIPVIVDVTPEDIESEQIAQLRREASIDTSS